MLIRPKDYHVLGTDIRLDKNKVYLAKPATNQPDYKKLGLVFCDEVLLARDEYEVIEEDIEPVTICGTPFVDAIQHENSASPSM